MSAGYEVLACHPPDLEGRYLETKFVGSGSLAVGKNLEPLGGQGTLPLLHLCAKVDCKGRGTGARSVVHVTRWRN